MRTAESISARFLRRAYTSNNGVDPISAEKLFSGPRTGRIGVYAFKSVK